MDVSGTMHSKARTAVLAAGALLGVVLGAPRAHAQANDRPAANQELSRLEASLAEEAAKVTWLRQQIAQLRHEAEVSVRPLAAGTETRRTLTLTPSSTLDMTAARLAAWTLATQLPGGTVGTVMATGSMRPLFDQHALLILEAAPYDSLRLGDIVTYVHPTTGVLIVHRLLEKRGDAFWAKGDYNGRMDDAYVTRQNYRMRVCGILYTHQE
jgi:signal peptidase I